MSFVAARGSGHGLLSMRARVSPVLLLLLHASRRRTFYLSLDPSFSRLGRFGLLSPLLVFSLSLCGGDLATGATHPRSSACSRRVERLVGRRVSTARLGGSLPATCWLPCCRQMRRLQSPPPWHCTPTSPSPRPTDVGTDGRRVRTARFDSSEPRIRLSSHAT